MSRIYIFFAVFIVAGITEEYQRFRLEIGPEPDNREGLYCWNPVVFMDVFGLNLQGIQAYSDGVIPNQP